MHLTGKFGRRIWACVAWCSPLPFPNTMSANYAFRSAPPTSVQKSRWADELGEWSNFEIQHETALCCHIPEPRSQQLYWICNWHFGCYVPDSLSCSWWFWLVMEDWYFLKHEPWTKRCCFYIKEKICNKNANLSLSIKLLICIERIILQSNILFNLCIPGMGLSLNLL